MYRLLLLSILSIFLIFSDLNADKTQETARTYQNYNLKQRKLGTFITLGLPQKATYKLVVSIIPENFIKVLTESTGEVRAFVDGKRLIFKMLTGEEVASFPLVSKTKKKNLFKSLSIIEKNKGIKLKSEKKLSFFVGLTPGKKSRKTPIPIEDFSFEKKEL